MNFLETFQMLGGNLWFYGGAFILVLSILVFVHEWGHYIVARLCGIRVETFSIGFGKELFGRTDKNGTRWKFALIPLGGYVKLFGDVDPASAGKAEGVEDEDSHEVRPFTEAEKKEAFFAQPVWKRAAVVAAGPAINYIFAIFIMAMLFAFHGQPVTPPVAAAVIVDSSADKHGFLPHDRVISIDGKAIDNFADIRREMMIALDEKRHFVIERDGERMDIYASPEKVTEKDRFGFEHSRGLLGLISPRNAVNLGDVKVVNGKRIDDPARVRQEVERLMDSSFTLTLEKGEISQQLKVNPLKSTNEALKTPELEGHDVLFLSSDEPSAFIKYPVHKAAMEGVRQSWVITRGTLEALGQMVTGTRSAKELGGVIRIGAIAGDMAQQGLIALIMFTALLSINLGLINLFPIPMLDGGHLVFYFFEAILRRPIPEAVQEYAFRAGFVVLIALMVFANLNDVIHLLL